MIGFPEIKREIEKFLKKDYLKAEIKKIKRELKTMDLYKKIPEPTLKHISQLEDQFGTLSKKITETQKQVDKEFNNALKLVEKRKSEASAKIFGLKDYALEQKEAIESRIREQLDTLSGGSNVKKTTTRKSKKKASKAKTKKKKVTKAAAKKKSVTKAKKKVAKKTSTRKKKTVSRTKS